MMVSLHLQAVPFLCKLDLDVCDALPLLANNSLVDPKEAILVRASGLSQACNAELTSSPVNSVCLRH